MRLVLFGLLVLLIRTGQPSPVEPTVRIGLTQNAPSVTVRSTAAFTVEGRTTRSATVASVLAVDPDKSGVVAASDVQHRVTVTLDGGGMIVMPAGARVRIAPSAAPLEIDTRGYRGGQRSHQ